MSAEKLKLTPRKLREKSDTLTPPVPLIRKITNGEVKNLLSLMDEVVKYKPKPMK